MRIAFSLFTILCLVANCLAQGGEPTNAAEAAALKAKAQAELDAKYKAIVKKLPPAQQAWERVLQAELGGFYLPIHKRQKVAGQSNAWDFVEDDPALPRVLLIGDSVSRAYTQTVRKVLAGKANVHRAPANCGPTATGLKKLDVWLGDGKWDLIHFNFGIHDRNTRLADYCDRLEQLLERLKATGATLIWANTTPLPDVLGKYSAASIVARNAAAAEVMAAHSIAIDDLFAAISPRLGELQNPNDCHFSGLGNAFLGKAVAGFLESRLGERQWSMDQPVHAELTVLGGEVTPASGVQANSLALDGAAVLQVKDSGAATHLESGFTCAVWVNPYAAKSGQQMIVAKNVYSRNQREWSVMIDKDGHYRLYIEQGGWRRLSSDVLPTVGKWQHVAIAISDKAASMWISGRSAGSLKLDGPIPQTKAPLTFGGVNDNGRIWQNLYGALDEAVLIDRSLAADEITALYQQHRAAADAAEAHTLPKAPRSPAELWDGPELPKTAEAEVLKDVEFHVIKKWEPDLDGYRWLHGVGLAWHKGMLYASYGHNAGKENTLTEEGRYSVSDDAGATWSKPMTIDIGTDSDDLAVSHGVFLSHQGTLWSFLGAFHGTRKRVHTRAYTLDESSGKWGAKGVVIGDGFWPMQEPVKMADGNWIIPGFIVAKGNPAAVAISDGDDLTTWKRVVIPRGSGVGNMWGESSIIVDGPRVLNIARYGAKSLALTAASEDFGQTWTPSVESSLPMATSKPASGMLSTGQRYLVCSTTADGGGRRDPLTIAVSRPGEAAFSKVYVIRHAESPDGPGESHPKAALSYPYTIEHGGNLYVGYSNSGGRGGNHNSAELAVVPIASLAFERR